MIHSVNKVSFIGFGHLAQALIQGALEANALSSDMLTVTSPSLVQGTKHSALRIATSNKEAADADVIILAVKPQQISSVCSEIAPVIKKEQLIISLAAGVSVSKICGALEHRTSLIVRAMPNTAVAVRAGVTALYYAARPSQNLCDFVSYMFSSTGLVIDVAKEEEIDLITALSGSGPAYFFYLQEALVRAGVRRGLSEETAHSVIKQTMYGASLLTQHTLETFQEKRAQVTSAGGTTSAAIQYLEEQHFLELIDAMVEKAYLRAQALK